MVEVVSQKVEEFDDVALVAEYFQKETGIITYERQYSILQNKVAFFCRQNGISSFVKLLDELDRNINLKQELIDTLTTNETFFYREFKQIESLVELVKKSDFDVSILCAPSSTGEEPYSIAIALLEAGVSSKKFSIVGIDINADAIKKAKIATYGERNIRNLSQSILNKYFTKDGNKYIINESVKSLVSFRIENIFDNSFKNLGKFDFVFSRNMLIYFDKETKLKAKEILESMRKTDEHGVFFGHADLY
ncbi:MAG: protein-glutamate O-methyltransferase CheR [Campylobacterales bacterium]|nr:protein-glutamate O-methyltransferase CheR [Campylobacterales bacterium]